MLETVYDASLMRVGDAETTERDMRRVTQIRLGLRCLITYSTKLHS